ncbi:PEP-CTERM sorting domain-containing protein [Phragmitibacter flavus]|nr:PEP-CTERM sorting domain-containing protein [Phragmitibacter flavus]
MKSAQITENSLRRLPLFQRAATLLAILTAFQASTSLQAIDYNWTGPSGIQDWSVGTNWSPLGPAGANPGTTNADKAIFNTSTAGTLVTIDSGRNIRNIEFGLSAAAFTIGSAGANLGAPLSLSSGGSITMLGPATVPVSGGTLQSQTIHAPLILEAATTTTAGSYSFTNNANNQNSASSATGDAAAAAKMIISGNISGGTTSSTITLTLAGNVGTRSAGANPIGFTNVVSGEISNGSAAGGLAVTINGATPATNNFNAWTLNNANSSYTGATTITNGALYFNSIANTGFNSSVGAGSSFATGGGAHVIYYGGATSTNRNFTFNGGSFYNSGSGNFTMNGTITNTGGVTFRGGSNFIINTIITGLGGVSRTDNGTVFLNELNTFSGNVSISDGTFVTSTINNGGVGAAGTGIGTGTQISLGQDSGTVGRLQFTGTSGGSSSRLIRLTNGSQASSGNGRIENTVAGQTLTLSGTVKTTSNTVTHVSSLELLGAGNGVMSGVIGGTTGSNANVATNTRITKTGTGTWALTANNIYYGVTTVSGGTLLANNDPATGSATGSGNVVLNGAAGANATLGGTGSITGGPSSSITIGSNSFLMVGNTHGVASGVIGSNGYTGAVADLNLGSANVIAMTLAGTLQFDLFGNDVAAITTSEADLLKIASTAATMTLGGTIAVADVSGAAAGSWTAGTWQLIDWSGYSGSKNGFFTFALPTASLAAGYVWDTSAFLTNGTISIAAVPEPGRVLLIGLGTATLLFRRRRPLIK